MSLAIVKAARDYLRLDRKNTEMLNAINANENEKERIQKQWGDALMATITEIREVEKRKQAVEA
jgi:hypothetical protein